MHACAWPILFDTDFEPSLGVLYSCTVFLAVAHDRLSIAVSKRRAVRTRACVHAQSFTHRAFCEFFYLFDSALESDGCAWRCFQLTWLA